MLDQAKFTEHLAYDQVCLNFFLSVNCLDRHVEKSPNRVALIWERDEPGTAVHVTYRYGTFW